MNIWITGASSGLGMALAIQYAADGHRVIASARPSDALNSLQQQFPRNIVTLAFDYEAIDSFGNICTHAFDLAHGGTLDVVILNAGISQRALLRDSSFELMKKILSIDLLAPMELSRHIVSNMRAQGGGQLAVVSSLAGFIAAPMRSSYAAAKHGINGFFKTLAAEEADAGIDIRIIAPGAVKSRIAQNALTGDMGRYGRQDDFLAQGQNSDTAARRIARGLKGKRLVIYTGYGLKLGFARFLGTHVPSLFHNIVKNRTEV